MLVCLFVVKFNRLKKKKRGKGKDKLMVRTERTKVRKAMENMLQKAALKVLAVVNRDKDHIPPITTSDSNPFPYRIVLNPRSDSWQNRIGLH